MLSLAFILEKLFDDSLLATKLSKLYQQSDSVYKRSSSSSDNEIVFYSK